MALVAASNTPTRWGHVVLSEDQAQVGAEQLPDDKEKHVTQ